MPSDWTKPDKPPDTDGDSAATGPYQPAPAHALPTAVSRFQLREILGEGAFGRVYRAYDPQLDRDVALKVPRFPHKDAALVERFLREARAAARLRHPGIVAVFEAGQDGDVLYLATELVAGQPLSERIAAERPSVRQAAEWIRTLALALHYAHEEGIVHRDVKPSNIMVDRRGRVQLMDFGLAKRVADAGPVPVLDDDNPDSGDVARTAAGTILGTPAYMAPEQARGELEAVGPHSDQYSLGVVLYELLTGQRPFKGKLHDLRRRVADPDLAAESPSKRNPDVPPDLAKICQKALAKQSHQRYANLAALAVDLQRWLQGEPVNIALPVRTPRKKKAKVNLAAARRILVGGVLAGVFVAALVGVGFYLRSLNAQLRHADQVAEEARLNADRAAAESRRAALARDCDLYRERGLRLRGDGKTGEALLWLAHAAALADELGDGTRHAAVIEALGTVGTTFDLPPGMTEEDKRLWLLAGNVLLGIALPDETRTHDRLATKLDHAGAARFTAYGDGGRVVLTADEPASRQQDGPGKGQRTTVYEPFQLRDAASGKPLGSTIPGYERLEFSPSAQRVIRLQSIWTVRDLHSYEDLGPKHPHDWVVTRLGFNHNGTRVALLREGEVDIWDLQSVKKVGKGRTGQQGEHDGKFNLALSPDGSELVCWEKSVLRRWPAGTEKRPVSQTGTFSAVTFHPDGQRLAVATPTSVDLYDLQLQIIAAFLPVGNVVEIVFSPDGRQVLTRTQEKVQLWDAVLKRPSGLVLSQPAKPLRMQFRPDGKQILLAANNQAWLWPNLTANTHTVAVRLWAEATAGAELTVEGKVAPLSADQRHERRQRLEAMTGIAAIQARK